MISGYEFFNGPWQDMEWLLAETTKFYDEQVVPKGIGDMFSVTRQRIMETREWAPSRSLIDENFDAVLRELNIVYIPKQVDPGPAIVFPHRDLYGRFRLGKMRPLYELVLKAGPAKYVFLGKKNTIVGPVLFGNTDETLTNIGRLRRVVLVEGYFDLLACRLLMPDLPVISTGTKSVNDDHIHYLQMLGVEDIYLLLDNEDAKGDRLEGAGNQATRIIANLYSKKTSIRFHPLGCPNNDPALCLTDYRSAILLRDMLRSVAAAQPPLL